MTEDEAQRIHDEAERTEDAPHHGGCWCCCWDCDFDFNAVLAATDAAQETQP